MNADNLPLYFKWHEHGMMGYLENEHTGADLVLGLKFKGGAESAPPWSDKKIIARI